jgi:predicted transcriptional regulator YdeE
MDVKIVEREETIVGGYSAETTLENSGKDLEILFEVFNNGKIELLNIFSKNTKEYYGVIWYTKLHESYKYLIGQKVSNDSSNFEIKKLPKGIYAYSKFSSNYDPIKAWTDFYQVGIPEIGYKPIEKGDIAFEYYPNGIKNEYELWSLVEKNI